MDREKKARGKRELRTKEETEEEKNRKKSRVKGCYRKMQGIKE